MTIPGALGRAPLSDTLWKANWAETSERDIRDALAIADRYR